MRRPSAVRSPTVGRGGVRVGDGDLLAFGWRKSSACDPYECVEVALTDGGVRVRASHRPYGHVIAFQASAWEEFLRALCGRTLEGPA